MTVRVWTCIVLLLLYCSACVQVTEKVDSTEESDLLVFTIATEETDGFIRFMRSANKYGYNTKVVGMGQRLDKDDVLRFTTKGDKSTLLKKALTPYKDNRNIVVMFVDSYDTVFTRSPQDVIKTFKKFSCRVVFSAENFCWPDPYLSEKYPQVELNEMRYLNSEGFIGYARDIYEIIANKNTQNKDGDQLYYTNIYLDESLRNKWSIKLDSHSEIFQNLNGSLDDVKIKFKGSHSCLYNTRTDNTPIVVHGNGPVKYEFNRLADYLADQWTPLGGCAFCLENTISLDGVKDEDFPEVMVGIFLEHPVPFSAEFLHNVAALNYPKKKMDIFIYYNDPFYTGTVEEFYNEYRQSYTSITVHNPRVELSERSARNKALEHCVSLGCQYFLSLDGEAQLENVDTLQYLIEQNRTVISPLLLRVDDYLRSNFWGSLDKHGDYKQSNDYLDILNDRKVGIWNIPYMTYAYLIHGSIIPQLLGGFKQGELTPDKAICKTIRDKGIFMYISNTEHYGHLVNADNFKISHVTHPDMYQIFDNRYDWEKKYIHPQYHSQLDPNVEIKQPCPDVFWMPMVTTTFCKHLIQIMEANGQWSDETNNRPVPTVEIQMYQVGLERHWLYFLKKYVAPLTTKNYSDYCSRSVARLSFMVRYKPTEQSYLRPHHDDSTFSINIAMNRPHIDFQGGGTRFIRQNCSMLEARRGWMLMHPGRLTHYHEGLPVTKGTRYIMVTFVDP